MFNLDESGHDLVREQHTLRCSRCSKCPWYRSTSSDVLVPARFGSKCRNLTPSLMDVPLTQDEDPKEWAVGFRKLLNFSPDVFGPKLLKFVQYGLGLQLKPKLSAFTAPKNGSAAYILGLSDGQTLGCGVTAAGKPWWIYGTVGTVATPDGFYRMLNQELKTSWSELHSPVDDKVKLCYCVTNKWLDLDTGKFGETTTLSDVGGPRPPI